MQEQIAGTHPNDPSSYLKVNSISLTNGVVTLQFVAVSNRTYSVQARDTLTTGAWQTFASVLASPITTTSTVTNAVPGASRFYRLVTPSTP